MECSLFYCDEPCFQQHLLNNDRLRSQLTQSIASSVLCQQRAPQLQEGSSPVEQTIDLVHPEFGPLCTRTDEFGAPHVSICLMQTVASIHGEGLTYLFYRRGPIGLFWIFVVDFFGETTLSKVLWLYLRLSVQLYAKNYALVSPSRNTFSPVVIGMDVGELAIHRHLLCELRSIDACRTEDGRKSLVYSITDQCGFAEKMLIVFSGHDRNIQSPDEPCTSCQCTLQPSHVMSEVSSQELNESTSVESEAAQLEERHRNFEQLLARLDRSTEEIRLLRYLIERRIREMEHTQASSSSSSPSNRDTTIAKAVVHYESMIKSDAFGQCNICFEDEPYDPVGCIYCLQLVGCRRCVNQWYDAACLLSHKQCPLCRHEWEEQPEVMDIFELKIK